MLKLDKVDKVEIKGAASNLNKSRKSVIWRTTSLA